MTEQANSLAWEYAREKWGKDYSYTMLPDDPVFARELRNIKKLEDIISWLMARLEHHKSQSDVDAALKKWTEQIESHRIETTG